MAMSKCSQNLSIVGFLLLVLWFCAIKDNIEGQVVWEDINYKVSLTGMFKPSGVNVENKKTREKEFISGQWDLAVKGNITQYGHAMDGTKVWGKREGAVFGGKGNLLIYFTVENVPGYPVAISKVEYKSNME